MKISVCVGSACHLKGSRAVLDRLHQLVDENNLRDKVRIVSMFCIGKCQQGVCVTVDDRFYSVSPDTVRSFFETEIMAKV